MTPSQPDQRKEPTPAIRGRSQKDAKAVPGFVTRKQIGRPKAAHGVPYINQEREDAQKRQVMNQALEPAALRAMWLTYKRSEDTAKAMRLEVEEMLLTHFPSDKQEGSITDADNGITVTYKLNRSVDTDKVQAIWDTLSVNAQKAFKWKAEVDLKNYRAIQDLDRQSFAQIATCVTTKSAKPSITIKE